MKRSEMVNDVNGNASRSLDNIIKNSNKDNYHETIEYLTRFYLKQFEEYMNPKGYEIEVNKSNIDELNLEWNQTLEIGDVMHLPEWEEEEEI